MKKLELFVVQDIYDTIESAEHCTVFFPWCPASRRRAPTSTWSAVSGMRPCLPRRENEISDYEAILGVGRALGMGDLLKGWGTPKGLLRADEKVFQGHALRHHRRYLGGWKIPGASSGPLREGRVTKGG